LLILVKSGHTNRIFAESFKYNLEKNIFSYICVFSDYEIIHTINGYYAYAMHNKYSLFKIDISKRLCFILKELLYFSNRICKLSEHVKTICVKDEHNIYFLESVDNTVIKQ